jgi:hypothetical protein
VREIPGASGAFSGQQQDQERGAADEAGEDADGEFGAALSPEAAGPYASPLEMARWAPSASNRQPVRIVRSGASWHFYIQRTPGYLPRFARTLTGIEDLQRVDSGIAMCHFELTARELGLTGRWVVHPPAISLPDALTEYSATWEG